MIHIIQQSSLEKIRCDTPVFKMPYQSASCLVGEEFAYQLLLYSDCEEGEEVSFNRDLLFRADFYLVKQVPVPWPHFNSDSKDDYLLNNPGLLPDILVPIKRGKKLIINKNPTVIWVSLYADYPGNYDISITFSAKSGEQTASIKLNVLPNQLPSKVFHHVPYIDLWSIADSYRVPIYCNVFWDMLEKYFELAHYHGVNTMVVPLVPLLEYGPYPIKPTQLVRLSEHDNELHFDFDLFDSWIYLAQKKHINNIVIPPLFPSFKTMKCPEFIVTRQYRQMPLFDQKTSISSPEYLTFARKLVHKFLAHLKEIGFEGNVEFQFSNDPDAEASPAYNACLAAIDCHVKGRFTKYKVEALHDVVIDQNKPKTIYLDHAEPKDSINLLITASAARLRSLGMLCYYRNIHRMFNFSVNYCYSKADLKPVNICISTDNENSYPSGSCFIMYPELNGPAPSIRLKQLFFAQQDYNLLIFLERIMSRAEICKMLERELNINDEKHVITAEELLALREKIAAIISQSNKV